MKTLRLLIYFLLIFNVINGQEILTYKTSDGESLSYTKTGDGPIIIFLAGGPGSGASLMQPWADTLSNKYECIVFDQRGTGLSSNVKLDSSTINLERAIMDIENLRKHLGGELISLCGYSWGGGLAQAYASFYPQNVKKLVLVSTLGPDLTLMPAMADNIRMRRYPNERDSLLFWNEQPSSKNSELRINVFTFLAYVYDHKLGYNLLLQEFSKITFNLKIYELMMKDLYKTYDLKPRLINYKGHCIIIKPRQDVIPEEGCFIIKELLPQTKFISIERCGHLPYLENPKAFYPALKKAFSDYQ
jgi:proline iminopeptidase